MKSLSKEDLSSYICQQLNSFFPDKFQIKANDIEVCLADTLKGM